MAGISNGFSPLSTKILAHGINPNLLLRSKTLNLHKLWGAGNLQSQTLQDNQG